MRYDFYTDNYGFRQMEYPEVKELEVGDKIAVCVCMELPKKIEFVDAVVVTPMFWNSNADNPDWEVETDIGFVDIHDIYEVAEL
jgi:hypothetical protein